MSEPLVPMAKPDDQLIEAGEVGELKDLPFHEAKHLAETARSVSHMARRAPWSEPGCALSAGLHPSVWRQRGSN